MNLPHLTILFQILSCLQVRYSFKSSWEHIRKKYQKGVYKFQLESLYMFLYCFNHFSKVMFAFRVSVNIFYKGSIKSDKNIWVPSYTPNYAPYVVDNKFRTLMAEFSRHRALHNRILTLPFNDCCRNWKRNGGIYVITRLFRN